MILKKKNIQLLTALTATKNWTPGYSVTVNTRCGVENYLGMIWWFSESDPHLRSNRKLEWKSASKFMK